MDSSVFIVGGWQKKREGIKKKKGGQGLHKADVTITQEGGQVVLSRQAQWCGVRSTRRGSIRRYSRCPSFVIGWHRRCGKALFCLAMNHQTQTKGGEGRKRGSIHTNTHTNAGVLTPACRQSAGTAAVGEV